MKKTNKSNIIRYFFYLCIFTIVSFIPKSFCGAETNKLTPTDAFKWYEFGKINISISSTSLNLTAGAILPLNFKATNNNKFPIAEGSLYVKIYREKETDLGRDYFNKSATKEELNDKLNLVDQFFTAEDLSIDAGGTVDFKYDYKIPQSAQSGKYRVVAYFQSVKKFNLQGLSFTDDTPGSIFHYEINNNEQLGTIEFERNNILINGEPYDFNSALKIYGSDENVNISALLSNFTNTSQKVDIFKTYYSWDGLDEKNIFGSDKENIILTAGEKKKIEFLVPKTNKPVSYVVIKAKWNNDSQSIVNIRFAREVSIDARINSVGITKFPIKANESASIFVTAHEVRSFFDFESINKMANDEIDTEKKSPSYRLDAVIKDNKQNVLQSFSFEGELLADVLGFEGPVDFKEDRYYLIIESTLTNLKNNSVVDKSTVTYHCQNRNYAGCPSGINFQEEKQAALFGKSETAQKSILKNGSVTSKIIAIIILIILLLFIAAGHKKIKKILTVLLFFSISILIESWLFLSSANAESITYTASVPKIVYKCPLYIKSSYNYFWQQPSRFSWSATYSAKATTDASGFNPLAYGSSLVPGQEFYVTNITDYSTAISYYQTGSYADTPYAYFKTNAARDNTNWSSIYSYNSSGYWERMSTSFSFNPLSITAGAATNNYNWNNCTQTSLGSQTLTTDANAPITCVPFAANIWKCTVSPYTTATTGSVKMVYGCTFGALYYKAWREGQTNSTPGSCGDRFTVCNYYEGLFQQKLVGIDKGTYGIPEGVCGFLTSGSSYTYPPLDGCRKDPSCINTGPGKCTSSNGTEYDYRPTIPQKEIIFSYNISQPDFQISSFVASPPSGEAPLNGVELKVALTSIGSAAFPNGSTAIFNYDCDNGNSYTYSTSVYNGNTYTLPQTCSYNSSIDTIYRPRVFVTIGLIPQKSAETPVSVTTPKETVSCGSAIGEKFCFVDQLTSNLCVSSEGDQDVHDAPFESNNVFNWTCGDDGSVSCSAQKNCSSDAIWREESESSL